VANLDRATVDGFGDEWSRFDQAGLDERERREIFDDYFSEFPWAQLPAAAVGADIGCGSGRWAALVAPRVGRLLCFDASPAAARVAATALAGQSQCVVAVASVDALPVPTGSLDFAYSLGVLHHVPDTAAAVGACVQALKPDAPLLLYLYYAFDDRPAWFRTVWRLSDLVRRVVSRLPYGGRWAVSQALALLVYLPVSRCARLAELLGRDVDGFPLSFYRRRSVYVMRTDALDRFGTRLEQRFTKAEITAMLHAAGLRDLRFREGSPYWTVVGTRN
jgi:SAM-dependent methyltransferase